MPPGLARPACSRGSGSRRTRQWSHRHRDCRRPARRHRQPAPGDRWRSPDARQAIATYHQELVADAASPVGGNPDGDVTIVEFFDYRCPYCKQVEPALEALVKQDAKIRIIYKEFPVLGADSV